jgi:hypothetical protein
MTPLGLFLYAYVVFFVLFLAIWIGSIGKSNLARGYADFEIRKRVSKTYTDEWSESSEFAGHPIPATALLANENNRADILSHNKTEYLINLTSAYIVRSREPELKKAIEINLSDLSLLRMIESLNETDFRRIVSQRINDGILEWLGKNHALWKSRIGFTIIKIVLSLIIDKYIRNFREIKDRVRGYSSFHGLF